MAAIEYRGTNAVTNFDLSRYIKWLRPTSEGNKHSTPPSNSNHELHHCFHHSPSPPPPPPSDQRHHHYHTETQQLSPHTSTTSPSTALGFLLQSSKFKEMIKRTSAADVPLSPPESDGKQSSRCSFPDDIQTYFECNDSVGFAEGDDTLFGELNAFEAPIFHCGLDIGRREREKGNGDGERKEKKWFSL